MPRSPLPFFSTAALLVLLAGCAAPETILQGGYVQLAPTAPPASPYEIPPQPEDPTREIWRSGYWVYNGSSYEWVQGALIPRPDPSAVWASDRWDQHTYGWAFVPGYWQ